MSQKIRVLVVDDSSFMRSMLPKLIEKDSKFEVVGFAENGEEAIQKVAELKPNVVTLDIEMPVMDGLTALKHIMAKTPVPIVMVSTLTESGAAATLKALSDGAVDVLPKSLDSEDKNVFRQTHLLHEKLTAAASVKVGDFVQPVQLAAPTPVPVTPVSAPAPAAPTASAPAPQPAQPAPAPVAAAPLVSGQAKLLLVAASTGGPKALQEVLPKLPANLRVPVLVVQHMPAQFTAALADRLHQDCQLGVCEVQNRQLLKPGVIYVAPGGMQTRVFEAQGHLVADVQSDKGESPYRPSVDVAAGSVAELLGGKVCGVMLTGMGDDGSKTYLQLRQAGAHIITQDESTSAVYGMPRAVAENGAASEQLPLQSIAAAAIKAVG